MSHLFSELSQAAVSVGLTATHLVPSRNASVRQYVFRADDANTATVYLGASGVTVGNGIPMAAGDVVIGSVNGPGADSFYAIAGSAQTVRVTQKG